MTDHTTPRRRVRTALALVAAGLVGGIGATAANAGLFPDVPTEGRYGEHVANLQEAGIATGYADGSFRPAAAINRRQVAAWIDRAASRVGLDLPLNSNGIELSSTSPNGVVAQTGMESQAAGDGGGWVTLLGGVGGYATDGAENCPCTVMIQIVDSGGDVVGLSALTILDDVGAPTTSMVFATVPLPAGDGETYTVEVELLDTGATVTVIGAIQVTYAPLADDVDEFSPSNTESAPNRDSVESIVPALP